MVVESSIIGFYGEQSSSSSSSSATRWFIILGDYGPKGLRLSPVMLTEACLFLRFDITISFIYRGFVIYLSLGSLS